MSFRKLATSLSINEIKCLSEEDKMNYFRSRFERSIVKLKLQLSRKENHSVMSACSEVLTETHDHFEQAKSIWTNSPCQLASILFYESDVYVQVLVLVANMLAICCPLKALFDSCFDRVLKKRSFLCNLFLQDKFVPELQHVSIWIDWTMTIPELWGKVSERHDVEAFLHYTKNIELVFEKMGRLWMQQSKDCPSSVATAWFHLQTVRLCSIAGFNRTFDADIIVGEIKKNQSIFSLTHVEREAMETFLIDVLSFRFTDCNRHRFIDHLTLSFLLGHRSTVCSMKVVPKFLGVLFSKLNDEVEKTTSYVINLCDEVKNKRPMMKSTPKYVGLKIETIMRIMATVNNVLRIIGPNHIMYTDMFTEMKRIAFCMNKHLTNSVLVDYMELLTFNFGENAMSAKTYIVSLFRMFVLDHSNGLRDFEDMALALENDTVAPRCVKIQLHTFLIQRTCQMLNDCADTITHMADRRFERNANEIALDAKKIMDKKYDPLLKRIIVVDQLMSDEIEDCNTLSLSDWTLTLCSIWNAFFLSQDAPAMIEQRSCADLGFKQEQTTLQRNRVLFMRKLLHNDLKRLMEHVETANTIIAQTFAPVDELVSSIEHEVTKNSCKEAKRKKHSSHRTKNRRSLTSIDSAGDSDFVEEERTLVVVVVADPKEQSIDLSDGGCSTPCSMDERTTNSALSESDIGCADVDENEPTILQLTTLSVLDEHSLQVVEPLDRWVAKHIPWTEMVQQNAENVCFVNQLLADVGGAMYLFLPLVIGRAPFFIADPQAEIVLLLHCRNNFIASYVIKSIVSMLYFREDSTVDDCEEFSCTVTCYLHDRTLTVHVCTIVCPVDWSLAMEDAWRTLTLLTPFTPENRSFDRLFHQSMVGLDRFLSLQCISHLIPNFVRMVIMRHFVIQLLRVEDNVTVGRVIQFFFQTLVHHLLNGEMITVGLQFDSLITTWTSSKAPSVDIKWDYSYAAVTVIVSHNNSTVHQTVECIDFKDCNCILSAFQFALANISHNVSIW